MADDERFEGELRRTLRDLAAEPAPERLVERVAAIPERTPTGRRRSAWRVAAAVAAAAVLVLAASVAILTRPEAASPIGAAPASTASPPPAAVSPSTAAVSSPSPVASVGPAGGAVPTGFRAVAVTFASPDLGWVLGTSTCATPPCTAILRTSDGGHTWVQIPAPRTPISQWPVQPGTSPGVTGLRFADALDGWAFGPDLWATHDGGATWRQLTIAGVSAGAAVEALETSAGSVHAVLYDVGSGGSWARIATSPAGTDAWTLSATKVEIGAGPVPQAQLVLQGNTGWMIEVDRTVVGGARLVNGAWVSWTPPCSSVLGPAVLAASSPSDLVASCDGGIWGPAPTTQQQGEHLYVSHDGGVSFSEVPGSVPISDPPTVATAGQAVIAVAGSLGQSQGPAIATTFDAGQSWATFRLQPNEWVTYLGFTTPTQGVAIAQAGGQGGSLLMTRDGGHTWSTITFGGAVS